jgi:hypothetical protein
LPWRAGEKLQGQSGGLSYLSVGHAATIGAVLLLSRLYSEYLGRPPKIANKALQSFDLSNSSGFPLCFLRVGKTLLPKQPSSGLHKQRVTIPA